MVENKIDGIMI